MPRRQNTGPGPKSKKTHKSKNSSFLGDSTATEASDAESFQSAELQDDHTDYGFDYTTSPRTSRRSELSQSSPARRHVQIENRSSTGSPSRSSFIPNTRTTPRVPPPIASKKKPRKQKKPLARERMMWNQIRELQRRTDNLTPKAPFGRLIREILMQNSSIVTKITVTALEALQISCEIYLTNFFADAYVCTLHRGRVTLGVHDVRLVRFLRGPSDPGNK